MLSPAKATPFAGRAERALAAFGHNSRVLETIAKTAAAPETRLGRSVAPRARLHPGQSGIVELRDGRDAFAARVLLADTAERTLDLQYYIWRKDMSGSLLFAAVCRAADRGVRVRLLLDDNNTAGLDGFLGALTSHPNIKVRLFNPFRLRRFRPLEYLTDFARLNRRMHNKSFTVDGQVAIVGGRNIGDEYFDAHQALSFVDLDVMAVGPAASEIASDFERYWQSESARPAESILGRARAATVREVIADAEKVLHQPAAVAYINALQSCAFVNDLLMGTVEYRWSATRLVSDDPAKGLGRRTSARHDARTSAGYVEHPDARAEVDLAVSRADSGRRAGARRALASGRRAGDDSHECSGGDRRADRARGLCEAPAQDARSRRRSLRAHACRTRSFASRPSPHGQLRFEPACEDVLGRRRARVRRLVQPRSALGEPQYRNGLGDRKPGRWPSTSRQPLPTTFRPAAIACT